MPTLSGMLLLVMAEHVRFEQAPALTPETLGFVAAGSSRLDLRFTIELKELKLAGNTNGNF